LWDTRNGAVTAHVCLAAAPAASPAAELSGLSEAAARIGQFLADGERFLVCLPLSRDTLAGAPGRARFLEACNAVPEAARQYLVFILGGIPAAVTRDGLVEMAAMLRPFGRTVASLAPGCRDLAPYLNHAVSGLALDFGAGFADSERTRAVIGCVGEASQDLRWGAMALGLDDPRLLAAVQAADFRFLHGAAAPRETAPVPIGTSPDARGARL
jgi:hypothetical protein